jgi:DNA-binding FadR family transcriptional regulator
MSDAIPDIAAESAGNVAYGAAMQAVIAAARAWRGAAGWITPSGYVPHQHRRLVDAIDALDALEARLRERGTP